ncbi:MAG: tetraacyldisaccharide 4'-kinase [Pirellulaceae bacterium]|nr:tetraacyldisaccharide 4'-kinase [Pirellulaceae bacterium]
MLSPSEFRDIVSGRRIGPTAAVLRTGLRLAEIPYATLMRARNACYDRGVLRSLRVPASVISVGNLTVGGTGKTPLVEWLVGWFRDRGVRVGVVSRGYKARDGAPNDEALELASKIPELPHVQNRDRVAAARQAIDRDSCRVVVLDDAFQHRRIQRDLDLVLLDALEPFGWEHVLPRGTLREPVSGLGRAHVVALSRADAVTAEQRAAIRARVRHLAPAADWIELVHQPTELIAAGGRRRSLESLSRRRVAAFCGIGNPDGFRHTLDTLGCQVLGFRSLPDHFGFPRSEVAKLAEWVEGLADVDTVLCTRKDMVKLECDRLGSRELWAVSIGLVVSHGQESFERRLQSLLERDAGTRAARTPDI